MRPERRPWRTSRSQSLHGHSSALLDAEADTFEKVFTVTTRASLEHIRDARNRWGHFDEIDAMQASQDVREMQMLLADLGAIDEARRMAQIQRTLDLMVRSGRS